MGKKKSSLMTPDPYHVPGYCGYVPQFKYRLGQTFGSHTHQLLMDDTVPSSSNSVLADSEKSQPMPPKTQADFFASSVYDNFHRFGNQKYLPQMVPGYTGYVPKGLHLFGNRYAESCHSAISAFRTDCTKNQSKRDTMTKQQDTTTTSSGRLPPLKPVAPTAAPYMPVYTKHYTVSPSEIPHGEPDKYFISGYTGFVPRQQKYIGQGYPIITHRALTEHGNECKRLQQVLSAPVTLNRPSVPVKPVPLLYKKGQGLLPRYTGHIPGQRYKFGMTFGTSTNRAVSEINV